VVRARLAVAASTVVAASLTAAPAQPAAAKLPTVYGYVGPAATISIRDGSGATLKKLQPGKYAFKITDRSKIDNFHLVGATVNLKTPVKGTTVSVWVLTMKSGAYKFYSDKHSTSLHGAFTVT
jgi:hypothetical protein